jgi:hypothetical protein
MRIEGLQSGGHVKPLDRVTLLGVEPGTTVVVSDGAGREYFRAVSSGEMSFVVAGSLGSHAVKAEEKTLNFNVDAVTEIDDGVGGPYGELLTMLHKTMLCHGGGGVFGRKFRGKTYQGYVHWILDHSHTAKGMQFFASANTGLVDLERELQRDDGMVWSFIADDPGPGYFDSRDAGEGYTQRRDGLLLVRQPVENHCEYNFVDSLYLAWKADGDDAFMHRNLDAAKRALDYSMNDRARWSSKFGLLKRGYTIDSWDFQIKDSYAVPFPMGTDIKIDADRTKFGIFFGDNTGYAMTCDQLAEMLHAAGRENEAKVYSDRARAIRDRLDALAWNGKFYQHRIEEDPTVKRDLGVDESAQIAMSNAYCLNRGCTHEQAVAIINTYLDLKANLPSGSPGEWYAIYPPYERGFGGHSGRWQYMNAGVHGHAAGELARGAFANGFEEYGVGILDRLLKLGRAHGGIVHFAYTGAIEPPPPKQIFTRLSLAVQANMDLWDCAAGGERPWMDGDPGNDLRNLPVGSQVFAGVPFSVIDPAANQRRSVIAISTRVGFPAAIEIPADITAGALYLLHTVNGLGPSGVAGAISFVYDDDSSHTAYILGGKHVTGWWFPKLSTKTSGIAWRGPNPNSSDVGICWAAIENPQPAKRIVALRLHASLEGAVYALLGVTAADRMPIQPVDPVSTGGPDNWSGGTCMLALVEGLAGVRNAIGWTALRRVELSPRWAAADVKEISICARYPASAGYVAYRYRLDPFARAMHLLITGGGETCACHVLLPAGSKPVKVALNGRGIEYRETIVEHSRYADFVIPLPGPCEVIIGFATS